MEKKMTKAERILRFIGAHPQGLMLGEIQKFVYEMNFPGSDGNRRVPTKVWRKDKLVETSKRVSSGYYGTNLCGGGCFGPAGLLDLFCTKTADRRYVLTEEIKAPFYGKKRQTKTLKLNSAHREREYMLKVAMSPKCPSCKRACTYGAGSFWSPDQQACVACTGRGYSYDCRGRVWTKDGKKTTLKREDIWALEKKIQEATDGIMGSAHYDLAEQLLTAQVISHIVKEA